MKASLGSSDSTNNGLVIDAIRQHRSDQFGDRHICGHGDSDESKSPFCKSTFEVTVSEGTSAYSRAGMTCAKLRVTSASANSNPWALRIIRATPHEQRRDRVCEPIASSRIGSNVRGFT
jgi:hypothetical protein